MQTPPSSLPYSPSGTPDIYTSYRYLDVLNRSSFSLLRADAGETRPIATSSARDAAATTTDPYSTGYTDKVLAPSSFLRRYLRMLQRQNAESESSSSSLPNNNNNNSSVSNTTATPLEISQQCGGSHDRQSTDSSLFSNAIRGNKNTESKNTRNISVNQLNRTLRVRKIGKLSPVLSHDGVNGDMV
jgi:hypothetical protein